MIGTLVRSLGKQLRVVRKCSMRTIYLNGLGNGGYLYRYFSPMRVTTKGALTQGGCYEQVSGTAHPMEVKWFDPPVHSLTQTEPSVSKMEISGFYYGISKLLASEAYLTSSMIAQETSYLSWILTVIKNSFWSGAGSDASSLKWTYTLDLIFPSLILKLSRVTTTWGFIEWQTTFILYPSEQRFRSKNLFLAKIILTYNHGIYWVFFPFYSKPQKLLAWNKNHKIVCWW